MTTILDAFTNIQAELKAPKTQRNNFGGYSYRSCEDILEAVKPLLKKYGCYLTITDEIVSIDCRFYVKATATLTNGTDTVSTSAYAREVETKKGMDESQITGSASSYARKYALNGLLAIDDTKDADSLNTGDDKPEKKTLKKVEPKQDDLFNDETLIDGISQCNTVEDLKKYFMLYQSKVSKTALPSFIKAKDNRKKELEAA